MHRVFGCREQCSETEKGIGSYKGTRERERKGKYKKERLGIIGSILPKTSSESVIQR